MKLKKPKFWDLKNLNIYSICLIPLAKILEFLLLFQRKKHQKFDNIKKICVGNIYIGGTGKTSLALTINKILKQKKIKSCFIKKFYNNQLDEQKILSQYGKLFVSKNRVRALKQAISKKYKIAIFDDGLQDRNIKYDVNFVCFNTINWIGNGKMIPAGPLRENISNLKKYKNIVLNGNLENIYKIKRDLNKISTNFNIHIGKYIPLNKNKFDLNKKYLAFSGIGNHETFISMLKENKFNIIKDIEFPDHYNYLQSDLNRILSLSNKMNCKIITTEKDIKRIKNKNKINFIKTELKIEDEEKMIEAIFENNE